MNETLVCDHSNESYRAVLSCGTVCFLNFGKRNSIFFPSIMNLALLGVKGLIKFSILESLASGKYLPIFSFLFVYTYNKCSSCTVI